MDKELIIEIGKYIMEHPEKFVDIELIGDCFLDIMTGKFAPCSKDCKQCLKNFLIENIRR